MSDNKDPAAHSGRFQILADLEAEYYRREKDAGGPEHAKAIAQELADECGMTFEEMKEALIPIMVKGPC